MARSNNGQVIRESQRTAHKLVQLDEFFQEAAAQSDLATWRRGRAVLGYIHGKSTAQLSEEHRLPPYSPEFNPTEGVWKTTRKMATHNRFYPTVQDRDAALRQTFDQFQLTPELIDNQVARFRSP